ncbi:MAG: hypothetical protein NC204_00495 [Candidatus Amulumruptor caecigallinarius]|nr:hypothetical protein [Candidatus Amulumruptor caecigallinarius]
MPLIHGFGGIAEMQARKTTLRLKTGKEDDEPEMTRGSFMVASDCSDCNNGYHLNQVSFQGYEKPLGSNVETFFITNNTNRRMSGLNLYVEYETEDGRQLHKRFVKLTCDIPPFETRRAEIKSWDKQKSFYYIDGPAPKRGGAPFRVIFDPVAFYLRF